VSQLEAALLFAGYPAGAFSGERALTRYEFAVAIQRLAADAERAARASIEPDLRAQTPRRDSPWLKRPIPEAGRAYLPLRPLIREFRAELAMLGADTEKVAAAAEVVITHSPSVSAAARPLRRWPPEGIALLETGSPVDRARAGMALLRDELASPSLPIRYFSRSETHEDFLFKLTARIAGSGADAETLLDAWRALPESRLRDCLTLTLGFMARGEVRRELELCATDLAFPRVLRVQAAGALADVVDDGAVATLVRLLHDPERADSDRLEGGCIRSGRRRWVYPIRQAAQRALQRLEGSSGPRGDAIRAALKTAVTEEPWAPAR
jgi:hypothetical protein